MFVYQRVTYISKSPLDYFGNIEANHWNALDYDNFFLCPMISIYFSNGATDLDGN